MHLSSHTTCTDLRLSSQTNNRLLNVLQIWKDAFTEKQKSPYMSHEMPGRPIDDLMFVPYEVCVQAVSPHMNVNAFSPNTSAQHSTPYAYDHTF